MKRPISSDPLSGKQTYLRYEGDDTVLVREQKVDHIIKQAHEIERDYKPGNLIGNTQKHTQHIAEIPQSLYFDLIKKLGHPKHNKKAWARWLNDPENRFFRTGGGHIG